ncbi:MAG: nickel-dependent lactate racemase [Spirochaetia bacterium]|nr:nickel-dependent lactate racemase [Spirochaetia bacterium]MCF7941210.1 nickel-dependent lactate racemase [Spirochaetia bacterium]
MAMTRIKYDKGVIDVDIPEENLQEILIPREMVQAAERSEAQIVEEALTHPIDSEPLSVLAAGKQRVVIITSDHTRPVPSSITLPILLREIRRGNPDASITIIIATGLHRGMTHEEMVDKFGEQITASEHLINHDASDSSLFVDLGILPSGSICEIHHLAVEADLLIAEGFIEPHFFAGFSGGRKSVLPGVASQACVNSNHCAAAIAHPLAATGILDGNPIHEDMIEAARRANLSCILNVLLDENKHISAAVFGEPDEAHRAGCTLLFDQCGVHAAPADIVITTNGGYPLDQNLYQCPKGLDAALACIRPKGVIIIAAGCIDGLGGDHFGELMLSAPPNELLEIISAIPPEQTISEQWSAQRFADALIHYSIILVTSGLSRSVVEQMNFLHAETVSEALDMAFAIQGREASVTVIPDGVGVIVRRTEEHE